MVSTGSPPADEKQMYGFAIIAALRRQGYELGPSALYPFLHSLEATEYIAREEHGVDEEVRKYHAIADAERAAPSEARGKIRELTGVVPEGRPPLTVARSRQGGGTTRLMSDAEEQESHATFETGRGTPREVASLFLKLGIIAFGGPAAHIALMRTEVVERRKWVTEQEFLDLLGASNLIPGPTSTELAIYLGYTRAGPAGLVLAGLLFILPAMLLVLAFAWAYVTYGSTPQATALLYGIKPVIIAVIVQAIYGLLRTAVKGWLLGMVLLLALGFYLIGLNPLIPLFGLSILFALVTNWRRLPGFGGSVTGPQGLLLLPGLPILQAAPGAASAANYGLVVLFLTFLKIGATLYGSGYVLLAFLRDDFVNRLGWLTEQQIVDAVAVGQFTPGPVFTTATFIGYILGGLPGAIVATVGIFLPSFVFVAVVCPMVPRLRASPWTARFLDGANAAAVGLMAGVAWQLGVTSIIDPLTILLALAAAVLLIRFRLNSAWLVIGGGVIGLLARLSGLS